MWEGWMAGKEIMSDNSPSTILVKILQRRSEHATLLNSLDELKPAVDLLEQKKEEFAEATRDVEDAKENLKMLAALNKKDNRGVLPQKMKKLFTKGNPLITKAQEEKKNRIAQDVHVETREIQRREKLEQRKQQLYQEYQSQAILTEDYTSVKAELDLLYEDIFDGPTPGYPEEDQAETEVRAVQGILSRVSDALAIECSTVDLLRAAAAALEQCQVKVKEALYWSTALMLANSPDTCHAQAMALSEAHLFAKDFQSDIAEARSLSPVVKTIAQISIAQAPLLTSQSHSSLRDHLKELLTELDGITPKIQAESTFAIERCKGSQNVVDRTTQTLDECKEILFQLRKNIFEELSEDPRIQDLEIHLGNRKPDIMKSSRITSMSTIDTLDEPPVYSEWAPSNYYISSPSLLETSHRSVSEQASPLYIAKSNSSARSIRSIRSPLPVPPIPSSSPPPIPRSISITAKSRPLPRLPPPIGPR